MGCEPGRKQDALNALRAGIRKVVALRTSGLERGRPDASSWFDLTCHAQDLPNLPGSDLANRRM